MAIVKATKRGFFGGQLRKAGDSFECPDSAFSERWMEKVKGKPSKEAKARIESEPQEVKAFNIPSDDDKPSGFSDNN